MSCLDKQKLEAWLSGEGFESLSRDDRDHLKDCLHCRREVRFLIAFKFASQLNSDPVEPERGLMNCAGNFDEWARLRYLDDLMNDRERASFEGHIPGCPYCAAELLQLESNITELSRSTLEVPEWLLAKAQEVGDQEALRRVGQESTRVWEKLFAQFSLERAHWLRPQWVAVMAVVLLVVASTIYYVKSRPPLNINPAGDNDQGLTRRQPTPPPSPASATVDPATVERVRGILSEITRATDGVRPASIQLRIINSPDYIAQISPNGELTLSTQYIQTTKNDDELAFLVAHEVSHFRHPAPCILSFASVPKQEIESSSAAAQKRIELQADHMGVFLASVAGYHSVAAQDFFSRIQNIPGISDASHPEFHARLAEIGDELQSIIRSIELFRVGVSFFNTEQYSRAVAAFEEVAKVFPSREAFNNLGLSYHKLALEYSAQNWGFKKSVILDPVARAIEPVREDLPQASLFSEFLKKAIENYQRALDRDPSYVAVRINLASAYDDQQEYSAATRELERVLKSKLGAAEKARALNNLGVVAAKQGHWSNASLKLKGAVASDPSFADPYFNLARVEESQNAIQASLKAYEQYARLAADERDGWLRMAFHKLNKPWGQTGHETWEKLPRLGRIQLGATQVSLIRRVGQPSITWRLQTPTHFEFSISLFETAGLIVSGSEGIIDFVQTTSRYTGQDTANGLSMGTPFEQLQPILRTATRLPLPPSRDSYINFERGIGITLRNHRVDTWFIFEPIA